ncbi:MAG TPA: TRC40/GET3/ArsA family transport-energizing ATPase [Actinomycetota bacterium]|nr:TRC40/GET3/ArsA family transport-energizing ATPase [Actinomycetota bacterium]
MRVIVFTGKGGVGKTSIAAATALAVADSGKRTLVMSTDPAHSLADGYDVELGSEPTEVGPNLYGVQIDAQQRLEEHWNQIQEYVMRFLDWAGADPVAAEEITVLPGIEEVFSLTDLRRYHAEGSFDCIVVDCAPTAETLRLLSLPEISRWYMERIFPIERKVVKAVRPVLSRVTSMPIATEGFFSAVEQLHNRLGEVGDILTDASTSSIRLVVNPERMVIAEARRMFTYLSLYGYRVDAVIANRLLPESVSDPYFAQWKAIQSEHLETIRESFAPVPVLTARLYETEMVGSDLLRRLGAEVYEGRPPDAVLHTDEPMTVKAEGDRFVLSLRLPFAEGRLDVSRMAEDLIVTVGSRRRTITLPASLRRRDIVGAAFDGPVLKISFGREGDGRPQG